ncbi:MAG: hypothetical protein MHM6MM_006122 [Cercozoa sp. M6MM]
MAALSNISLGLQKLQSAKTTDVSFELFRRETGVPLPHRLLMATLNDTRLHEGRWSQEVIQGHEGCVNAMSLSHCETRLASGGDDTHVRVFDTSNFVQSLECNGHQRNIFSVNWNYTDRHLVSAGLDGLVNLYDSSRGGDALRTYRSHQGPVHKSEYLNRSDFVFATASSDETMRIFDTRVDQATLKLKLQSSVSALATHPQSEHLLAFGSEVCVGLLDLRKPSIPVVRYGAVQTGDSNDIESLRRALFMRARFGGECTALRFDRRGLRLLATHIKGVPVVYDAVSGETQYVCKAHYATGTTNVSSGDNSRGGDGGTDLTRFMYVSSVTSKTACFGGANDEWVFGGSDNTLIYGWHLPDANRGNTCIDRGYFLPTRPDVFYLSQKWDSILNSKSDDNTDTAESVASSDIDSADIDPNNMQDVVRVLMRHRAAADHEVSVRELAQQSRESRDGKQVTPSVVLQGARSIPNQLVWHPSKCVLYASGVEKVIRVFGPFARNATLHFGGRSRCYQGCDNAPAILQSRIEQSCDLNNVRSRIVQASVEERMGIDVSGVEEDRAVQAHFDLYAHQNGAYEEPSGPDESAAMRLRRMMEAAMGGALQAVQIILPNQEGEGGVELRLRARNIDTDDDTDNSDDDTNPNDADGTSEDSDAH